VGAEGQRQLLKHGCVKVDTICVHTVWPIVIFIIGPHKQLLQGLRLDVDACVEGSFGHPEHAQARAAEDQCGKVDIAAREA
jgi:hypothetical protein